jgi:hypothetical protein
MMKLAYSLDSPQTARLAVERLRGVGLKDECIALAARQDIELERLPDKFADETTDINDGFKRGVALGASTGLLAGLVAASIPTFGVTLGGAALVGLVGAVLGGWSSALAGTTVPSELRREFEAEIEQGRVILGIRTPGGCEAEVERVMAELAPAARQLVLHHDGSLAA